MFFFPLILFSQQNGDCDSLVKLLQKKAEHEQISILIQLANCFRSSDIEQSKIYHQKSFELAQKLNDNKGLGDYYNNHAKFYLFEGNYDAAISNYQKSFLCRQKINDTVGVADVLSNMGISYRKKGDYVKALEFYQKALEIRNKYADKTDAIGTINNIGGLYYYQRNYEKAESYYKKALDLAVTINDSNLISVEYGNIALVLDDKGESKKALDFLFKALKIKEHIASEGEIALSYNNIGRAYEHMGEISTALEYFDKSARLYHQMGDEPNKCNTLYNIGDLNLKQKNYLKALVFLDSSYKIAQRIHHRTQLRDLYYSFAQTYHKLNNNNLAFEFLNKYAALNDSIYDENSLEQLSEMETKYQTQEREHEIELLQHENEIKNLREKEAKKDFRMTIIIAISSLIILTALIFALFIRIRLKKKAHDSLVLFNNEIMQKKEIIEQQKMHIEEKQKEIVDSINYAKKIQYALLANQSLINSNLKNNFILFKPKDIVSGDFYWSATLMAANEDELFYITACDSTGHGVPGAFMSLLSIGFLSEAINEKHIEKPNEVFDYVRRRLITSFGGSGDGQKDGFDGILVCINKTTKEITYAAANNNPVLISGNKYIELPANKMPVGFGIRENPFDLYKIEYKTNDRLYIYTDGYADQFGGPKGKKFKYKQLNELLLANSSKSFNEQADILNKVITDWRGNLEQVDDICVIGMEL